MKKKPTKKPPISGPLAQCEHTFVSITDETQRWLNKQHVGIEQVATLSDWDNFSREQLKPLEDATYALARGTRGTLTLEVQKDGSSKPLTFAFGGALYSLTKVATLISKP